jgi:hypothetical protein
MGREPDPDVAMAIELTAMCETFNCLPRAGGLMDQDPLHIYMMREVLLAQAEKRKLENKRRG